MELSQYNIVSKIRDSDKYVIVNLLAGQADILDPEVGRALEQGVVLKREAFAEKGYLVDPAAERGLFEKKYLQSLIRQESDEVQVFFVPWYACNFGCSYCYQSEYATEKTRLTAPVIDAFFNFMDREFSGRRYYTTLFGGEPLLPGQQSKILVEYFLSTAWSRKVPVAVVTNGYTLEEYVPLLTRGPIREVQVTLDGTREVHDARRPLLGSRSGTFDRIVAGIDAAMSAGLKINFRVVVDKGNIGNLPELASFAKERGWTKNPLFKTQLGRNYELHHCAAEPEKLFSRIGLYQEIYSLSRIHPEILEFHRPAYSISRFLWENGALPEPLFDACPGCKTEWALDYTGSVYSCTATVGKTDECLGTFFPAVVLDETRIGAWRDRNIANIEKCADCALSLACGGGCGAVARRQHGSLNQPDCRPVAELLSLGISQYFEKGVPHV